MVIKSEILPLLAVPVPENFSVPWQPVLPSTSSIVNAVFEVIVAFGQAILYEPEPLPVLIVIEIDESSILFTTMSVLSEELV